MERTKPMFWIDRMRSVDPCNHSEAAAAAMTINTWLRDDRAPAKGVRWVHSPLELNENRGAACSHRMRILIGEIAGEIRGDPRIRRFWRWSQGPISKASYRQRVGWNKHVIGSRSFDDLYGVAYRLSRVDIPVLAEQLRNASLMRSGPDGGYTKKELIGVLRAIVTLVETGWWWCPGTPHIIMCERPRELHLDDEGRLHREGGPAAVFADKFEVYAWRGMNVGKGVIMNPPTITRILRASNTELRRVLIERYGVKKFFAGGRDWDIEVRGRPTPRLLDQEKGIGKLYDIGTDHPRVVWVKNSTPEPDGKYKDYVLFVPRAMRNARQAVAWTFGLREWEYNPQVET